jgi:hypothetical protein
MVRVYTCSLGWFVGMSETEQATSFLPFAQRQTTTRDDGTHGAEGQNLAGMLRDNHLF